MTLEDFREIVWKFAKLFVFLAFIAMDYAKAWPANSWAALFATIFWWIYLVWIASLLADMKFKVSKP